MPGLLVTFHRRYPDVTLAVRSALVAELLAELDAGTVDALIAPIHDDLPDHYLSRPLTAERLTLVTAPGHLSSGSRAVSLATMRDETFICLPAGSGLHAILTAAGAEHGFTPRIQFEAPDPAGIRRFVATGLGVALLAESAARGDGPRVDVHRLTPTPLHPPIGLIRRRRRPTPALRAWLQHLEASHPIG